MKGQLMKKLMTLIVCLTSLNALAEVNEVACPIYELVDEGTVFDTSLQSILGGDEDYATLGMNFDRQSVTIGYFGWEYPQDRPDYTVRVQRSNLYMYADIYDSSDNAYSMTYEVSTRCIKFSHGDGDLIAHGRCTENSDNYAYELLKLSDLEVCWQGKNTVEEGENENEWEEGNITTFSCSTEKPIFGDIHSVTFKVVDLYGDEPSMAEDEDGMAMVETMPEKSPFVALAAEWAFYWGKEEDGREYLEIEADDIGFYTTRLRLFKDQNLTSGWVRVEDGVDWVPGAFSRVKCEIN